MIKKLGGTFGIVLAIVGIIEAIGLTFDILPRQAPLPTLTQDHILRARTEPGYQSYMWATTNCLTGDYDKAIKQLTETIELEPTFAEAYYYRGLVYLHLGRLERGVADLETVVELTPHPGLRRDARKELLLTRMADVLVPVHFVSLLGIVILTLVGEKARRFTVVVIIDVLVYLFTAVFSCYTDRASLILTRQRHISQDPTDHANLAMSHRLCHSERSEESRSC